VRTERRKERIVRAKENSCQNGPLIKSSTQPLANSTTNNNSSDQKYSYHNTSRVIKCTFANFVTRMYALRFDDSVVGCHFGGAPSKVADFRISRRTLAVRVVHTLVNKRPHTSNDRTKVWPQATLLKLNRNNGVVLHATVTIVRVVATQNIAIADQSIRADVSWVAVVIRVTVTFPGARVQNIAAPFE
jgi:hypothetical protein